jgi:transcription-repair coupling factor (superfamily II helicase)
VSAKTSLPAGLDPFAAVAKTPAARALRRRLESKGDACLHDIAPPARSFFTALLTSLLPKAPILVVLPDLKVQEIFHADLATWLRFSRGDSLNTWFFPAWEFLPHEKKLPHSDVISERLESLVALGAVSQPEGSSHPPILVASVTAVLQRSFAAADLRSRLRRLSTGDTLNPLDLIEWLEEQGYEPETQVSNKGELSWRGGIVDVWPLSSPWPVRLEFFGDEIESIREFDPHNQLSREKVQSVVLPPAGELGLLRPPTPAWAKSESPSPPESSDPPGITHLPVATVLGHLPDHAVLVLCDPDSLHAHALRYQQQVQPGDPFICTWDEFLDEARQRGFRCIELPDGPPNDPEPEDPEAVLARVSSPSPRPSKSPRTEPEDASESLVLDSLEAFRPIANTLPEPQVAEAQRRQFFAQVHRWLRQDYSVQVFCNNDGERQRFEEIWIEQGFQEGEPEAERSWKPHLQVGGLSRGFLCDAARVVVVTDAEIFGRYKVARPRRLKSTHAQVFRSAFEIDFTDFDEGDFVVHLQHGIGIYRGLKTLPPSRSTTAGGAKDGGQECLVIEYAPRDATAEPPRLYVPVSEAHLVSKYVGAGKAKPQLSTIGGTRWTKAKEQAEHAVRDLAGELLRDSGRPPPNRVTASRPTPHGNGSSKARFFTRKPRINSRPSTPPNATWSRPNPWTACSAAMSASARPRSPSAPRSRPSWAANRWPFSSPPPSSPNSITTISANAWRIIPSASSCFPASARPNSSAPCSRPPPGAVDIVIGTHRIVQADTSSRTSVWSLSTRNRNSASHKETFKLLRQTVDVLTLSATPIPRTLYFALTGARDLSTLETPPQDRLPVETIVTNYDERIIRDAIWRELNPGARSTSSTTASPPSRGSPSASGPSSPMPASWSGHGQMDDDELERVMTQFVNGEADVLVSTTIIESGLDIPNANTMIIDRADRFGLSDLYQLRGRVGRYKHQAYCYLLLPRHAQLLTEARKRMSAIKQYSALGSGFKIAMRDLEIRGAGNLLGAEQSGHITAVGFDLYCQLLARSVSTLKGEKPRTRLEVRAQFDFLAMHPGQELANPETNPLGGEGPGGRDLPKRLKIEVQVPRETFSYSDWDDDSPRDKRRSKRGEPEESLEEGPPTSRAPAYLPLDYVREPEQRVEVYRKLGQLTDRASIDAFKKELRDRFGPVPPAVELILAIAELRCLAAERQVTSIEVVEGKIKLTRRGDLITVGGQFPRLTKKDAGAKLGEIKRLLMSL